MGIREKSGKVFATFLEGPIVLMLQREQAINLEKFSILKLIP